MSRKIVLFYATCQGSMLLDCLNDSEEFGSLYHAVDCIHNYELIRNHRSFLTYLDFLDNLKKADLFIYQPLRDEFKDNATSHLLSYLKPDAKAISIPYAWNSSFWPLMKSDPTDISDRSLATRTKESFVNAIVLKKLRNQGMSIDDILAAYDNHKIDFNYTARFARNIKILSFKEQQTDVKIVDYITSNHKNIKLFTEPSHPTYHLLFHMANQILNMLRLQPIQYDGTLSERYHLSTRPGRPYDITAKQAFEFKFDIDTDSHLYYRKLIEEYLTGKS